MRIAYFDCISGISGNMTLGALLACGLPVETLQHELEKLHLPGWELHAERVLRKSIAATYVTVDEEAHEHEHEKEQEHRHGHAHGHADKPAHTPHREQHHHHAHNSLSEILALIDRSELSARVKERASAIFSRLGTAEAAVHGSTLEQVHFHEVGAVDAIIDIVGSVIALEALGIERVIASPLPLGHGWATCAHGTFPVPAPATAELVRGVPLAETEIEAELVTPTGAAIITTLAERFGPLPSMTVSAIGYGAGSHDIPRPNVLRVFLGDIAIESAPAEIVSLETNIDDLSGETLGYLMERLFAAGALDVFYTPIQMKKNRPAILVRVLCALPDEQICTGILFAETTTLGVRRARCTRTTLPRSFRTVETPYGPVRVKLSRWGEIERAEPEYEDCRALAEQHQVPLRLVTEAAKAAI